LALGHGTDPVLRVAVNADGADGADGAALVVTASVTTGVDAVVAGAVVLALDEQAAISIVRVARQATERRMDAT
jgi:hypothetical protein